MITSIAMAKAQGKYKGRANGTTLSAQELVAKHSDIVKEINNYSIRRTARLVGKSKTMVEKVKKAMKPLK